VNFFWTKDEGKWIAFDKICHFILHFAITYITIKLRGTYIVAYGISQTWGWLYEWLWDCWLVGTNLIRKIAKKLPVLKNVDIKVTGASKKDIVANTTGSICAMIAATII